jgi:type VI secretion system secreted protein VgrG
MSEPTQALRRIAINTPLGPDVLLVRRCSVREQMNRLFRIELDLISKKNNLAFDDIIGQNATLRLELANQTRYFNGFVSRFVQTKSERSYSVYKATLVPWLWFLTRTSDCRIFQESMEEPPDEMTVPGIIKKVFKDFGFEDFRDDGLSESYRKWEFCVQYRETAFNFVSRLMEQEGIGYFFEHTNGKHTLVLTDSINGHSEYENYDTIPYHPHRQGSRDKEAVTDWVVERELQPGTYAHNDYDFLKPKQAVQKALVVKSTIERPHDQGSYEIYDYPGEFVEHDEGEAIAKVRIEELQVRHETLHGEATALGLCAGYTFTLESHPRDDQNRDYLIVSTAYDIDAGDFETANGEPGDPSWSCALTAIPCDQPFRPIRTTPKPLIQGVQTAIVTGPEGEEIHTDEHARVKVQFHWDRYGNHDQNSSCWIRVSQHWAGKEWGSIHIPRLGQEVIVEFLEGDPDRPIITGRVYNGEQVPPYALPTNKTQSGIKSRSTLGGTGSNFNEFRFEDKKGSEEVFLHGEKDWTIKVKNNEGETVGSNISTSAGGNISRNAGANISRTADVTITDKAGKDILTTSTSCMKLEAGGSYELLTGLGIQLKTINFLAAKIESGAKDAAKALVKGGAAGAKEGSGASGKAEAAAKAGGAAAVTAFGPTVAAVTADLTARQAQAGKNMATAEGHGEEAGKAAAELHQAVDSGASNEVIAAAVMALASACYDTYKDAKKLIEDMLPQIPSIVLWAMKDISATALWGMTLQTKVRDITIEAKNKDIHVKAKRNVNVEACTKDLNIKASKKKVVITGKEEVHVTAEDKNLVIEAKKKKVFVKSADQIFLKCGSASISMAKSGNIVIKGAKININGSGPVTVKGTPIKLN